jgi:hypothetical protein
MYTWKTGQYYYAKNNTFKSLLESVNFLVELFSWGLSGRHKNFWASLFL